MSASVAEEQVIGQGIAHLAVAALRPHDRLVHQDIDLAPAKEGDIAVLPHVRTLDRRQGHHAAAPAIVQGLAP